jgi:hypothetical protein
MSRARITWKCPSNPAASEKCESTIRGIPERSEARGGEPWLSALFLHQRDASLPITLHLLANSPMVQTLVIYYPPI